MLALSRPAALRNMVDMGLIYDDAVARLDRIKPAAHMDGFPYYNPALIARAVLRKA